MKRLDRTPSKSKQHRKLETNVNLVKKLQYSG